MTMQETEKRTATDYLEPSATLRHEPLVYEVYEFIVAHQGETVSVNDLCDHFFGTVTDGLKTKMRQTVETIVKAGEFDKLIISTHDGYLHPFAEQTAEIDRFFGIIDATIESWCVRRAYQLQRIKRDGQYKLALGRYDKPVYEAITRGCQSMPLQAQNAHQAPYNPPITIDDKGNVRMEI